MDERIMNSLIMDQIGKKFGDKEELPSKYLPKIPATAEREYVRLTNAYMQIVKEELEENLPKLRHIYWTELANDRKENQRQDSATDFMLAIAEIFTKMANHITAKTEGFGLRRKLENLANLTRKLTVKEWKKAIHATLGINLLEDYYLGEFYRQMLELWTQMNVDLIKTIPQRCLDDVREVVYDGFTKGRSTKDVASDIQHIYGVSKRRAKFIARDQIAKLNGQIQRAQQLDAGIDEYIWCTSGDERVRDSHKALEGKKCSWLDPPENSDGRKCHPGEDYNCRCIGRPVFKKSTLNIPLGSADQGAA